MANSPLIRPAIYGGGTLDSHDYTTLWGPQFCQGDSGMYPYQRTPIGNPYISPI